MMQIQMESYDHNDPTGTGSVVVRMCSFGGYSTPVPGRLRCGFSVDGARNPPVWHLASVAFFFSTAEKIAVSQHRFCFVREGGGYENATSW